MIKGPDYWRAFNDGKAHGEKDTLRRLVLRLNGLKEVPGIGEKTFRKIEKYINGETVK